MIAKLNKQKIKFQILLADFLIIIGMLLAFIMSIKDAFQYSPTFNLGFHMWAAFAPILILTLVILGFGLFIEYKYNKLNFKNIFLLLGIILFISNIIAVSILPSRIYLTNYDGNNVYLDISIAERFYSILFSFCIGIAPFLIISVFSRNILHKKYLKYFIYFIIFIPSFFTLLSFFTDFNNYIYILKTGFSDSTRPVVSIIRGKFAFCIFLYIGIIGCTYLHSIYKNWKWLLLGLLFFFVSFFTFSKLPLLLICIYVLLYAIIKLIFLAKKNKENLKITIFIFSFALVIGSVILVLMINSSSGILFKIKSAINNAIETAKTTFRWRTIIWDSSIRILNPLQWIFGFGFYISGKAVHQSYFFNPAREESADLIWHSHNTFIQNIMDGGIIYLLLQLFYFGFIFYITIKIYKKNKFVSIMNFYVLISILIIELVDQLPIFGDGLYTFITLISVVPVMSIYYSTLDQKEINRRKHIILEAKQIKKLNFDRKVFKWNKSYLLNCAKNITSDLKEKGE